jgi:hypothetical protein
VLPSRNLYKWLTDRIGNFQEIEPYFPVWAKLDYPLECVISVYEIEHDAEDVSVPLIPKGSDGMAKGLISSRILPRRKTSLALRRGRSKTAKAARKRPR